MAIQYLVDYGIVLSLIHLANAQVHTKFVHASDKKISIPLQEKTDVTRCNFLFMASSSERPFDPCKGQNIHRTLVNPLIYTAILFITCYLLHTCLRIHQKEIPITEVHICAKALVGILTL